MNVWLITIGEPVPIGTGRDDRLHRTGSLATHLARENIDVTWWTSTFNHFKKKHICEKSCVVQPNNKLTIRLIRGWGYQRNVCIARIIDHALVANKFAHRAECSTRLPDAIVAALPSLELPFEAVRYGRRNRVPVIVDIRDLWPDIFVGELPKPARYAAERLITWFAWMRDRALREACGIWGVSRQYLEWGLRYARRSNKRFDAVVPLGYERSEITPNAAALIERRMVACGVRADIPIALFAGMLGNTYDIDTILNAASVLRSRGEKVQFVIAGDGPNLGRLKSAASGASDVVFTGWLQRDELTYLLNRSKLGLMAYAPNAPQSLPNKLFEYLSAGLPVISSLQSEAKAFISDRGCGLSYKAGDSGDLAAAITKVCKDQSQYENMRELAFRSFSQFDARRINAEMHRRIVDLVEAHHA